MKDSMRTMARPYAILFAIALVVALLARIGLAVMDAAGWLAYDYISASGVPMLDVICSILTGSAFVAFLFAAALTLMVSAAGAVLQAALFAKGVQGAGKPAAAFLWGWAAAAVSLVCLLVVASGILSGVQVGSMSSKLPGAGALVLAAVCFTAFLGTLLGAASQVMCACISRAGGRASWNLVGGGHGADGAHVRGHQHGKPERGSRGRPAGGRLRGERGTAAGGGQVHEVGKYGGLLRERRSPFSALCEGVGRRRGMRELCTVTFRAFDTVCAVSADVDVAALRDVETLCARYELLLSRFNPESRLSALNAAAGEWVDVDNELAAVLRAALGYCERTGGLFDITMGGVCRLWDFKRGVVPDDAAIAKALAHVDWRNVQIEGARARIIDPQATIDLGGMAKGYIADGVIDLLKHCGATSGVISLGGNVACLGSKPDGSAWNVGLRAPVPSGGSLQAASFTSVPVRGKSVVTSGVYERAFVRDGRVLHHILDPRTGKPAETDVLSATVIADKSLDADGYTTALIVMGADEALTFAEQTPGIEAILLTTNARLLKTTGITAKGTTLAVG